MGAAKIPEIFGEVERRVGTKEFAARLNMCEKTFYERLKLGEIEQPYEDGRRNYWLNSYVVGYIRSRAIKNHEQGQNNHSN